MLSLWLCKMLQKFVSLQNRMSFNLVCLYMYAVTELLVCCMGSEQKRYVEVTNQHDQLPISSNGFYMGFFLIGVFILFCLLLCAAVVDVERHARDFMETAKSLQLFFIKAQHQHKPTREEALRKEIATLEAELKAKDALIEAQEKKLQSWQGLLQAQRNVLVKELEQV